jgi:hypothetical protein
MDVEYRRKPPTFETLGRETETLWATVPMDTLATGACTVVRRTQRCLQANGGKFGHVSLLNMCRSHPFLCVSNLDYQ